MSLCPKMLSRNVFKQISQHLTTSRFKAECTRTLQGHPCITCAAFRQFLANERQVGSEFSHINGKILARAPHMELKHTCQGLTFVDASGLIKSGISTLIRLLLCRVLIVLKLALSFENHRTLHLSVSWLEGIQSGPVSWWLDRLGSKWVVS